MKKTDVLSTLKKNFTEVSLLFRWGYVINLGCYEQLMKSYAIVLNNEAMLYRLIDQM